MSDNIDEGGGTDGMDRRTLLRRAAVGGAVVWAAPVVHTVGGGVAAAATPDFVGCPEGGGGNPPQQLIFTWTGDACGASGDALENSSGDDTSNISQDVKIQATYGPGANSTTATWNLVSENQSITFGDGLDADEFDGPNGQLNPRVVFSVIDPATDEVLRTVSIHTSCSQPLLTGDTFCGFTLTGGF